MTTDDSTEPTIDPIPDEYATVTPFVMVDDTAAFLEFLTAAFDATERARVSDDEGRITHAEAAVGDSLIMAFDSGEGWPDTPCYFSVYVENCDDVYQAAIEAGAVAVTPLATTAWGDRSGRVRDPFGNVWAIQTRIEDVSDEEIEARMAQREYLDVLTESMETLDREMRARAQ